MSVLSDLQIMRALVDGDVVCRPLRVENIRGSSIDLTLGEWFWRCDARPEGVFNPYDEAEVERYFAGPYQAKPYASVYEKIGWRECGWPKPEGYRIAHKDINAPPEANPFKSIPADWPVIVLRPGERILAHTYEFFGTHPPGTTEIRARSSTGRIGVTVCLCAGWGDPGYINRWTMEMMNLNREAIVIPVGERVAQGIVHTSGMTREHYGVETLYESKYQLGDGDDEVIANWTPRSMLPRNYKDTRTVPLPLDVELYLATLARLQGELERAGQVPEAAA